LLLLILKPTQIFNVGAQLSFLAVCGIIWISQFDKEPNSFEREHATWIQKLFSRAKSLFKMSLGIWLFTAPVVLTQFHLITPIGLVLNLFLMPFVTIVLFIGYLTLILSLVIPVLGTVPAFLFDLSLTGFTWTIQTAGEAQWGNRYAASPEIWWLVGYYILLIFIYYAGFATQSIQKSTLSPPLSSVQPLTGTKIWHQLARHRWIILCSWISIGLAWALVPSGSNKLSFNVLSVGHGSAVLIEFPNGRHLLYDAGSLDGGIRAANAIESTLFTSKTPRIDTVVISHADIDHFNACSLFMQKIPVGSVCFSSHFLDFNQQAVSSFVEELEENRTPIQILQQGDQLQIDSQVEVLVLHPDTKTTLESDNDHSVVLLISYAGRKILLTGDLELEGQAILRQIGNWDVDVVTAPHHGAREENSRDFYNWCQPEYVTISSGQHHHIDEIRSNCTACQEVLSTQQYGAIRFEIQQNGSLTVTPWLDND